MDIRSFIQTGWDETVRDARNSTDETLIKLPYPYTVPCKGGMFQEMYYWDTYFACRGLLLSGRVDLVKNNLKNFMYLLHTYGFIPNGSRLHFLTRSQPPFFGLMVRDYYNATGDRTLLAEAYEALLVEYKFWTENRMSDTGLNCYGAQNAEGDYAFYKEMYEGRVHTTLSDDTAYWGLQIIAEAESGWDFNPRFAGRCHEYNPVDLNSLLYFDETYLGEMERILGRGDGAAWDARAALRRERMIALMTAEDGVLYDYSYVDGKRSHIVSCASFFPYFVGMLSDGAPLGKVLEKLELSHGLQATEACEGNYQWGQTNGWACLHLVAVEALEAAGRAEDALRIARKYVALVEKSYAETDRLWEKYNVDTGDNNAVGEYGTPEMLGWSAGVYLACKNKIETA